MPAVNQQGINKIMEKEPNSPEKVNPVCEICHKGHKTSQHTDLLPKTIPDKGQDKEKPKTILDKNRI